MRKNNLRKLKFESKPIINAWISIGSGYAAEMVAHQGFDAVTIDCQHGLFGYDTAVTMLQAISTTDAVPMARPSANDPAAIMRLLDAGAFGIICPMISNRADAEKLVAACRYAPDGNRSFGPARAPLYGGNDYAQFANEEITVLAMIETAEGLQNLSDIVKTPGLDGIYIGPNDLALALGYPPIVEHPEAVVKDAIATIRSAASENGLICGIFCSDGPAARMRIQEGFDLVTPGNDAIILKAGMKEAVISSRFVS